MYSFKLVYFVIFLLNLYRTRSEISDKRLCIDKDCSVPISLAKTLLRYSSPDPRILSFKPNEEIKILSKEAGSLTTLWGAVIHGKRGYIPSKYVRELRVLGKPTLIVDTELKQSVKEVASKKIKEVTPDEVREVAPDVVKEVAPDVVKETPEEVTEITPKEVKEITPNEVKEVIHNKVEDFTSDVEKEVTSDEGKEVAPDKLKDSFEIIDGTTLFIDSPNSINPSSTESPVLATTTPTGTKENTETSGDVEASHNNIFSSFSKWASGIDEDESDDEEQDDEDDEDEEEDNSDEENVDEESEELEKAPPSNPKSDPDNQLNLDTVQPAIHKSLDGELSRNVSSDGESKKTQTVEGTNHNAEIKMENTSHKNTEYEIPTQQKQNFETTTEMYVDFEEPKPVQDIEMTENPVVAILSDNVKSQDTNNSEIPLDIPPIISLSAGGSQTSSDNTNTQKANPQDTDVKEDVTIENSKSHLEIKRNGSHDNVSATDNTETISGINSSNVVNIETGHMSSGLQYDQENIMTQDVSTNDSIEKKQVDNSVESNKNHSSDLEITNEKNSSNKDTFSDSIQSSTLRQTVENNVNLENSSHNSEEKTADHSQAETDNRSVSTSTDIQTPDVDSHSTKLQYPASEEAAEQNEVSAKLDIHEKNSSENFENVVGNYISEEYSSQKMQDDNIGQVTDENFSQLKEDIETDYSDTTTASEEPSMDNVNKEKFTAESADTTAAFSIDNINEGIMSAEQFKGEIVIEESTETFSETFLGEEQKGEQIHVDQVITEEMGGLFSSILSLFRNNNEVETKSEHASSPASFGEQLLSDSWNSYLGEDSKPIVSDYCDAGIENCNRVDDNSLVDKMKLGFNYDIFLYLVTTAISCIIFLFMYLAMDNSKRMNPLISKINKLEKELLVLLKENDLLKEKESSDTVDDDNGTDKYNLQTEQMAELEQSTQALLMRIKDLEKELENKELLEEQIDSLEKELETSTEVGMELNRIIAEMLDTTNGSDIMKENVEQFQRQLMEQKSTIASVNKALTIKESENIQLISELEIVKKTVHELQKQLDERVEQILKIEKEKDQQQKSLQDELVAYQQKYNENVVKSEISNNEIQALRSQLSDAQRQAELRVKEYNLLKESLNSLKSMKNDRGALELLLESTPKKAEYEQLKMENERYVAQLKQEQTAKIAYENKCQTIVEENNSLLRKYQEVDKEKVEVNMKLEVLTNYFKKKEEELQSEILKYKSIWDAKEGEATSTSERIRLMQEEIENYKSQNETLKQEIISQEIELKSQISILEKKVHENWVTARQNERKLEDARQEAAQLRNRLTMRERAMNEERVQNRLQSPLEPNGDLALSPHPIESAVSPPLLYGGRDHITKSPPLPTLPPHFLPPPPGVPFMPPPLPGMPFMPPPPTMFPGDHRPPPLGRMSSPPPLNSRYSPDTSAFSPYDRNSPSPPYDSEYGASPPPMRRYSPYDREDRRDYKRPHVISNGRNLRGSKMSSGSEHSNDSIDKINQKHSKMV